MPEPGKVGRPKRSRGVIEKRNSSPAVIARWERDIKCVEMRKAEIDWDTIVATLGYASRGHAHQQFMSVMRAYPRDDVETMRNLELDRLEKTAQALEKRISRGGDDVIRAAEVWNKISERRSKLLGLDRPEKKEVTVLTQDTVAAAIEKLNAEMELKARQAGVDLSELDAAA